MIDHIYDIIESLRIRLGDEELTAEEVLDLLEREITNYEYENF